MAEHPHSTTLDELTSELLAFRDRRDWGQFHNPKDLAIALSIEAGELLEHFLWRDHADVSAHVVSHRDEIAAEVADVASYLLYLVDALELDLAAAVREKLKTNGRRYPAP